MESTKKNFKKIFFGNYKYNTRKDWSLGKAYLFLKNKDTSRTKPIVSFYNWLSTFFAEKVTRALSTSIRYVVNKKLWCT